MKQVEDPADVGMGDLQGKSNLALESLHDTRLGGNLGADGLQGNHPAEFEVLRFVDLPHPALREKPHNLEAPREDLVGTKHSETGGRTDIDHTRSRRGGLAAGFVFLWGHSRLRADGIISRVGTRWRRSKAAIGHCAGMTRQLTTSHID